MAPVDLTPKQKQFMAKSLEKLLCDAVLLGLALDIHSQSLRAWIDGIAMARIIHSENEPPKPTGRVA
jgi:hypothetical protein